jgi:hypothetical protein
MSPGAKRMLEIIVIALSVLLALWWDQKHPFPIPVNRNDGIRAHRV